MPDDLEERYDAVAYPTHPQPGTHPERLAVVSLLAGLKTRAIDRCRVLDLGCGDGGMLLPLAVAYPKGEYVGVDIAGAPIARGQEMVAELGLANVRLLKADIRALPKNLGEFDYIVAHGVYSWVPEEVRDALLAACRTHLAPNGVAFISYNAMPGGHLREMLRDMMFFHTRELTTDRERIDQSKALVHLLASLPPRRGVPDAYQALMVGEARGIEARSEADFFHDDLAELNEPVYVSEFLDHAGAHDLKFVAEADYWEMDVDAFPDEVAEELRKLAAEDIVLKEQYLDFLKCRQFRKTVLCRKEAELDRRFRPDDVAGLYASCDAVAQDGDGGDGAVTFSSSSRGALTTSAPLLVSVLKRLRDAHPGGVSFGTLLTESLAATPEAPSKFKASRQLAEFLNRAYSAGVVELTTRPPFVVAEPGERPEASPLARLCLRQGRQDIVGLRSEGMTVNDDAGRDLILLLDGTRDRAALIEAMAKHFEVVPAAERPAFLHRKLRELGTAGMLLR